MTLNQRDQSKGLNGAAAPGKRSLPKRFYKDVTVKDEGGRAALLLDGKPVKTPGRGPLSVSSKALAEAIADEWRAQGDEIDARTMPLTKLANRPSTASRGGARPSSTTSWPMRAPICSATG